MGKLPRRSRLAGPPSLPRRTPFWICGECCAQRSARELHDQCRHQEDGRPTFALRLGRWNISDAEFSIVFGRDATSCPGLLSQAHFFWGLALLPRGLQVFDDGGSPHFLQELVRWLLDFEWEELDLLAGRVLVILGNTCTGSGRPPSKSSQFK